MRQRLTDPLGSVDEGGSDMGFICMISCCRGGSTNGVLRSKKKVEVKVRMWFMIVGAKV